MVTALLTQMRAKAQLLTKEYHKLQAEARVAKTSEEAKRKTTAADKVFSEINRLHTTIAKLEAKEKKPVPQKPATDKPVENPAAPAKDNSPVKKAPAAAVAPARKEPKKFEEVWLEDRIGKLEESQKGFADKIKHFSRLKEELTSQKEEAEKQARQLAQQSHLAQEKLKQQIERLTEELQLKEAQSQKIVQETNLIKGDANRQIELLKKQLEDALEKQKISEKRRYYSPPRPTFWKGFWIASAIGMTAIVALLGIVMMTPWLDGFISHSKCPTSEQSKP